MTKAATVALAPISGVYSILVRARNAFYRRGFLRTHQIAVPVISIGNLTTGGTGKTPLVEWTARELHSLGRKVCVLTRGYGRQPPGQRVVASNGEEILATVTQTGDEAWMLADRLRGVAAVVCDADRISAARWAIENLDSNVFVLDDAFQHQKIARNLNVLTIDATNPWGNRRILPQGILREPISELARADCVVITRADAQNSDGLQNEIKKIHPGMAMFSSRMVLARVRKLEANSTDADSGKLKSLPVGAFCAIGNPESFPDLLRNEGYSIRYKRSFRDHYNFTQSDIDQLVREAQSKGAQALLTTAKDAVKLHSMKLGLPCYVAEIAIEIDGVETLRKLIRQAIEQV